MEKYNMKITKTQLKQIIKENLEALPIENLIGGISSLVNGMDPEDVGVVFTTVYRGMEEEQPQPEPESDPETVTPIGFDRQPEKVSEPSQARIGFEETLQKMIKEEFIAIKTMAILREYVANDRKAQATLNHLSVQEQRILVQVKELMGMDDNEFEELLKDPRRLGDLISLISQEQEMQIAEQSNKEVLEEDGKGCADTDKGCIRKRESGWVILNNKKGGVWRKCDSRSHCEEILDAFHASKG